MSMMNLQEAGLDESGERHHQFSLIVSAGAESDHRTLRGKKKWAGIDAAIKSREDGCSMQKILHL